MAGGASLQAGAGSERPLLVFAALFGTALLARAVSSRFLASQSEPGGVAPDSLRISPGAFWATFRNPAHGRLLLYLIWIQMGVHVSAPYFTPFMLGPLKLSYGEYAVLTGTAFVARIAAMPALGSLAHRTGSRRLLWIASLGIVPLPALWLISQHFAWLLLVQVAAGIAWGAFELATLLVFFDDIPDRQRTSVLSMFNLANALAAVIGAGAGSLLFRAFGPELRGLRRALRGLVLPARRGSGLAAALDRLVHEADRARVAAARPVDAVVLVLLEDVRAPARDAAHGEHRREEVHRDLHAVVDGRRVEVDVRQQPLLALHHVVDARAHLVQLGAARPRA